MALQPTTRRGRYLFWRTRAEARERRSWNNRPRPGFYGNHRLNRSRDTRHLPKQMAYVGIPRGPWQPDYWESTPDSDPLKGTQGHPGIVIDTEHPLPGWGPQTHARFAVTTYYLRRQKRVPKLRELPLRSQIDLPDSTWYRHHYPFFRYPSGALNPNWWDGFDDDGNPPPPH